MNLKLDILRSKLNKIRGIIVIQLKGDLGFIEERKWLMYGIVCFLIIFLSMSIIFRSILFSIFNILVLILYCYWVISINRNSKRVIKVVEQPAKHKQAEFHKQFELLKNFQLIQQSKVYKHYIILSVLTIFVFILTYFIYKNLILSILALIATPCLILLYLKLNAQLLKVRKIKKTEDVFPDFLQLMASNLRAGMTIDKSIFLSAREEFSPLDEEILKTGKDITTGKSIELSLQNMSERIGSKKIEKIVLLIISGLKAGGNLATLLEETSQDLREKDFVEKRAASNVMMYVIFIFITVSLGAPALFALSNVLMEILTKLLSTIPVMENNVSALPFTMSKVDIPVIFVNVFSVIFIIMTDALASMILGLVSKGEEKEGLRYFIPILIISMIVFFVIKVFLSKFMMGFLS